MPIGPPLGRPRRERSRPSSFAAPGLPGCRRPWAGGDERERSTGLARAGKFEQQPRLRGQAWGLEPLLLETGRAGPRRARLSRSLARVPDQRDLSVG